jgi:hypothetical protein
MSRYFEGGMQGLAEAERMFLLVWIFGGETDNGGIEQFLCHHFGGYAAETANALRAVGATRSAGILEAAVGLLGPAGFSQVLEERFDALEALSREDADRLEEFTQEYFRSGEEYDELLVGYVREHPSLGERPPSN